MTQVGILPKLFIASSSSAKLLANELEKALRASDEVVPWSWDTGKKLSQNLLDSLIDGSKTYDFAVVLLTRDELVQPGDGTDAVELPRDNCVFELGLFMGAFGSAKRCILVSSLEPSVLFKQLSDIAGLLHVKINQPNLENEQECRDIAEEKVEEILEVVREHRRFADRPQLPGFEINDLLEMEADEDRIGADDVVLIKERRPPETNVRYARVVVENMERSVNYLYLFGSRQPGKVVEMLRSLLAAAILDETRQDKYEAARKNEDKKAFFTGPLPNLEAKVQMFRERLFIELIDDIVFDEFCIHCAQDESGTGYAKIGKRYVPVTLAAVTERFKYEGYKAKKDWPTEVIFDLVPRAEDGPKEVKAMLRRRKRIEKHIQVKFPEELHPLLISACFEPA